MAKTKKSIEKAQQAKEKEKDVELALYQDSLKKKINLLGSFFSILLILLGLFFLVNGLFGIVNKGPLEEDKSAVITDNNLPTEDALLSEAIKDAEMLEQGEIGEGLSTYRVKAETSSATIKALNTKAQIERTHRWRATDYEKGDIGIGEYQVQLGDTLWEIAEAVYGSGFEWGKLLDSNRNNVGFLKNGEQALIIPGQVLIINK